jgi:hypothetical protein
MEKDIRDLQKLKDQGNKEGFHRLARAIFKDIAVNKLGLLPDEFEVRTNKGGIAVLGETILHSDSIYVSTVEFNNSVLVRACEGRKDYCGKKNNYVAYSYGNTALIALIQSIMQNESKYYA